MKRLFTIAAAILIIAAPEASAQSFLDKLKEKAGKAVNSVVGENSEESEKGEKDKNSVNYGGLPVTDSRETLQPKRSSSFGWDGVVTPSASKFPIPLMNEFPAVPSAGKLANPTEADQIAYYKAIKAVTLRAEELNADTTCEDSFTEKWRDEADNAIMDAFGLTAAEYDALKNNTLSPAEEKKLTDRMRTKILGMDEEQLEAELKRAEAMQNDGLSAEDRALAATCAVYDKYAKELPVHTGCTAEEFKKATRESMQSDNSAASRAVEKKTDAYVAKLPADKKKEAQAFMEVLKRELTSAALGSTPGAGLALNMRRNAAKASQGLSPLMEKYQKIEKYEKDIMAAWPKDTWSDAYAKFSMVERKKIENIKEKIYSGNGNRDALYLEAMEIIGSYREKAAETWSADVQKRFNSVKNSLGDVIKIQRQAIADGIIPECSLWRTPLNLVILAGDILAEAYSEFPVNYPPMYSQEVVRQVKIGEGESAWWPEFYVTSNIDDVLAGKNMYKESGGKVYQFNAGKWQPVPDNFEQKASPKAEKPVSASWKSADGRREVVYNAEGGFLQFPEGDIVYPEAWAKQGNSIVWAEVNSQEQPDGSVLYKIVKCTYFL